MDVMILIPSHIQEGDAAGEGPHFQNDVNSNNKIDEKLKNKGRSRAGVVAGLIIAAVVGVLLGAYYCYRQSWYKGRKSNFR
jgi:ABC-type nitrate/sulfonate/bicarbonate transport system permease component